MAVTNAQEAEAVTVTDAGGATILFRDSDPTISCVLEEFAHVLQALGQRFADADALEMRCRREIEAKECLVRRQEHYGISDEENEETVHQLDEERMILKTLGARW